MSPDNFVQDVHNTQNYNRYGYVLNNPLLYTDPSGEFIVALVSAVVVSVVINGIANSSKNIPFFYGAGKAGVMGGISAAVSFGIGTAAIAASSTLKGATFIAQAGAHGIVGGAMSEIEGGKFISGFSSGVVSSLVSSGVEKLGPEKGNWNLLNSDQTKAAMIAGGGISGGISSTITGGDFWQGMRQGLITSGLNHVVHMGLDGLEQEKPRRQSKSSYSFGGIALVGEFAGGTTLGTAGMFGATTLTLFGSFTPLADDYFTSRSFVVSSAWSGFDEVDIKALRRSEQFTKNRGVPGSYTITFSNDRKYHGQGDPFRMAMSAFDKMARFQVMTKSFDWSPSISRREGYKAEYRRMQTDAVLPFYPEGWRNPINYNERNSPGKKYILQDGF